MSPDPAGEPIAEPQDGGPERVVPDPATVEAAERARRPVLERIGLAAIAVVMAVLFAGVAVAAFVGGEYFLAAMGAVGCMMTLAVGGSTLLRG
jgi:hypothetical protein